MKNCEKCNAEFECRVDDSCWCMELPTVDLIPQLNDCLCINCLKEIYDKKTRRTV